MNWQAEQAESPFRVHKAPSRGRAPVAALGHRAPWVLALLACSLGSACSKSPNRLVIKGPKGSLASTYNLTALPRFEEKGQSLRLRAIAYRDDVFVGAIPVRWTVDDTEVASVNQAGVLTILSTGQTKVRATAKDIELSTELAVEALILGKVTMTEPVLKPGEVPKLPMGEFLQFSAEVRNDRDEVVKDAKIRWESTTYAATISVRGKAEGRAIGSTTIMATAENGAQATVEIEVTDWPKKRPKRRR